MSEYRNEKKKKVFIRCLETASDCADVTWKGRWFHVLAPATENARFADERAILLDDATQKTAAVVLMSYRRRGETRL